MTRSPSRGTAGAPPHAQYDEALRLGILREATRRLRSAAPEKLGLRPLAASQGTSTTAIYTMFGGKSGLLAAVAEEADRMLAEALRESLRHDSVETDMRSLCRAYRRWALENQGLYALVVAEPVRSPRTDPGHRDPQWREPLLEIVDALVDEGVFRATDVREATTSIWASLHGVVSLELSVWRQSPSAEQYFETQLAAVLRSWAAGEGQRATPHGSANSSTGMVG
ncbi:TetR family transcriptional regulator [Dietzia sp. UCD-THP]|uniref:TetR/AcrR family transcriptional regulator n=1 Tax=Dietzia natronolimnaea TaxID=161920 RepID=A0A2A2WRD2_9ACTN|nr:MULTISPECIES: TetR-like C-terminal domain-containing protein [Dietzia]EYT61919.1 TetR family transcriptional regulator [Dietzia sp. UCD-THP]PAY23799.1 TetR/AcrR family transcriptional regulator [Dietzia natronolimnaea]